MIPAESYMQYPVFYIDCDEDAEMLKLFVEAGVDVNIRNEYGETALMECCMSDHRIVQALIEAGAQVNVRNVYGWAPLMAAAVHCAPESIKLLLAAGAHVNVLSGDEKETPYDIVNFEYDYRTDEGAFDCSILLGEAGALNNVSLDIEDFPDLSPLNYEFLQAVQYRDKARISAALESGADINATDRYGSSAMLQAVDDDDAELCRMLVERGISAQHIAAALQWPWAPLRNNHAEPVSYLLSRLSGELLRQAREDVLFTAIRYGNVEAVQLMLRDGVNPNCVNKRNQSALMAADNALENKAEIARLLSDAGAVKATPRQVGAPDKP